MPLIRLETSAELNEEKKGELLPVLSKIISEEIGKPETYVMVSLLQCDMMMSGEEYPAAFADIRSIGGLTHDVNRAISDRLCTVLRDKLDISPDRVYLNFTDIAHSHWGWNNNTFG